MSSDEEQPASTDPLASLLGAALDMERREVELLPELISETVDPVLRKGLDHHLEETREHVTNVEEMFRVVGLRPAAVPDPVLEGLEAEHRRLLRARTGDQRMLTVVATTVAVEHAEIARYDVLRALAEARGCSRAVELIVRTLGQERQALKLVCESMHRLFGHSGIEPELVESGHGSAG
ncbi:MAG: DUF892 family protein [Candidatus Dormibacteraeota bacterium]|nr:DUF892 family protein [Candidatus Dormibacteraeota bacterium]